MKKQLTVAEAKQALAEATEARRAAYAVLKAVEQAEFAARDAARKAADLSEMATRIKHANAPVAAKRAAAAAQKAVEAKAALVAAKDGYEMAQAAEDKAEDDLAEAVVRAAAQPEPVEVAETPKPVATETPETPTPVEGPETQHAAEEAAKPMTTETLDVILVGRHTGPEMPGVRVVETRNIEWSLDPATLDKQVAELFAAARERGEDVRVLFQNIPAVLFPALFFKRDGETTFGVIVSKPGPRAAGVAKTFDFSPLNMQGGLPEDNLAQMGAEVARHANGRAKVEVNGAELTVTVDPVTPFEFVRIDWVN